MSRLTTEIWIAAYLTRLRLAAIPAFIVQKGDHTAGAVLVKLNTLDGEATAYQRSFDLMTGERRWVENRSKHPSSQNGVGVSRTTPPDPPRTGGASSPGP